MKRSRRSTWLPAALALYLTVSYVWLYFNGFIPPTTRSVVFIGLSYVLVPGWSDFEEDLRALGEHFGGYTHLQRVEVLPYHTLGVHKYEAMGQAYQLQGVRENTPEQLDRAKAIFDEYFDCVVVN